MKPYAVWKKFMFVSECNITLIHVILKHFVQILFKYPVTEWQLSTAWAMSVTCWE